MTAWSGPWGVSFTANLTPDKETGLGKWTENTFIQTIRTGRHMGRGRPILPPMPYPMYKNFTDEDLKAIFSYLQSIPAIENRVPEPLPAGCSQGVVNTLRVRSSRRSAFKPSSAQRGGGPGALVNYSCDERLAHTLHSIGNRDEGLAHTLHSIGNRDERLAHTLHSISVGARQNRAAHHNDEQACAQKKVTHESSFEIELLRTAATGLPLLPCDYANADIADAETRIEGRLELSRRCIACAQVVLPPASCFSGK